MNDLRIGVLGCGQIALGTHLPILTRLAGVEIAAMAEPDLRLRGKAADLAPEAITVTDWREVVNHEEVDAVIVCLPTAMHAEAAIAVLNARKPLYLEKPIASELPDALRLLEAARSIGTTAMVGFHLRFHPLIVQLKEQLKSGRIGRILAARSIFSTHAPAMPGWKADRKSGGGVLLDLASHHIDLVRFIFDAEVEEVFARTDTIQSEEDTATLDLRLGGGVTAQSFFSLRSVEENQIELLGTEGRLRVDLYRSAGVEFAAPFRDADAKAFVTGLPETAWRRASQIIASRTVGSPLTCAYRAALVEFVRAASSGEKAACTLEDGYASLATIDAAEQSVRTNAPVRLSAAPAAAPITAASTQAEADDPTLPALSVVLLAPESWRPLATTLRYLRAQTAVQRMELIIVAESIRRLALDPSAVAGFFDCRIVEAGPIHSIGPSAAQAVRAASAKLVAFAEDHSFPEPTWAAALIEAHRGPWAAVGPLIVNANPATATSWADFFLGYGSWIDPIRCGERTSLPGHNSSYKRSVLLAYGDRLGVMLEAETVLHWDLRRKGLRLCQSAAARTRHTNFSLLGSFALACFLNGRAFAATRAMDWSVGRKTVYALASPLIPLVRFWKTFRDRPRTEPGASGFTRAIPALLYGLLLDGAGQLAGYALGAGSSSSELGGLEFNRERHVTARDRALLFGLSGESAAAVPPPRRVLEPA